MPCSGFSRSPELSGPRALQGAWRVHSLFPSAEGQWKVWVLPDPHFEILKKDKLEIIVDRTSCIFYEPTKYFLINIVVRPADSGRYIPWGIKNKILFNEMKDPKTFYWKKKSAKDTGDLLPPPAPFLRPLFVNFWLAWENYCLFFGFLGVFFVVFLHD